MRHAGRRHGHGRGRLIVRAHGHAFQRGRDHGPARRACLAGDAFDGVELGGCRREPRVGPLYIEVAGQDAVGGVLPAAGGLGQGQSFLEMRPPEAEVARYARPEASRVRWRFLNHRRIPWPCAAAPPSCATSPSRSCLRRIAVATSRGRGMPVRLHQCLRRRRTPGWHRKPRSPAQVRRQRQAIGRGGCREGIPQVGIAVHVN